MKNPACLPRCFDPVFADECYSRRTICCIEWDAGDGNPVSWDAFHNMNYPGNIPEDEFYHIGDYRCYCMRSQFGAIGAYGWLPRDRPEEPENVKVWSRFASDHLISLGVLLPESYAACITTEKLSPTVVIHEPYAKDLVFWEGDNYDFPDYPDWPVGPGYTFPNGKTWAEMVAYWEDYGLFVAPMLRWFCRGEASAVEVVFQAGWLVTFLHLEGEPDEGTLSSTFIPYAQGSVAEDWWDGDPKTPFFLERMSPDWPDSEVRPQNCNYSVCGEPTDCFPECISGVEDCDSGPPSHSGLLLTITAAIDCCLTGTFPLVYEAGSNKYIIPVESRPSCTLHSDATAGDVTFTLRAELSCGGFGCSGGPGAEYICLTIWMVDGNGDEQVFGDILTMLCSGGSLVEVSGTFEIDTFCGDGSTNSFDWVISG